MIKALYSKPEERFSNPKCDALEGRSGGLFRNAVKLSFEKSIWYVSQTPRIAEDSMLIDFTLITGFGRPLSQRRQ
jgi:hypothetical protein